jgi:uncharacterized phosphosugar-binding protein
MKDMKTRYLTELRRMMSEIELNEMDKIAHAGRIIGETIAAGKVVHVFGAGHSDIIALESFRRAGGLACINRIYDPSLGFAERIEGYGQALVERYDLRPGEVLIVISNSGRNPVPIEVAAYAREKGLTVIAITSLKHSISVNSRHSSGKKLYEIADIVIDNHGEIGDACVEVPRVPQRTGPTSTIIGSLVLNLIMIQATETCTELGKEAPIIVSQNLDGVDERNRALYMRYRQRIGELF